MTGKKQTDIIPLCYPDIIQTDTITYILSPKNGDTFPDLIIRANQLIKKLDSTFQNHKILLVTHGDFGKMIYTAYYRLNWQDVLKQFHFGNSEMLILSPETESKNSKLISIEQYNS